MGGICNLKNIVYQATIFPKENVKDKNFIMEFRWSAGSYVIITIFLLSLMNAWKTALSKHFWKLNNRGLTLKIQRKILKRSRSTTPSCFEGRCNLGLKEKIQIMLFIDPVNLLNQRCDFIGRCRHRNRFRLFWKIME